MSQILALLLAGSVGLDRLLMHVTSKMSQIVPVPLSPPVAVSPASSSAAGSWMVSGPLPFTPYLFSTVQPEWPSKARARYSLHTAFQRPPAIPGITSSSYHWGKIRLCLYLAAPGIRWNSKSTTPEAPVGDSALQELAPVLLSDSIPVIPAFFLFLQLAQLVPPHSLCTCYFLCLGCFSLRYWYESPFLSFRFQLTSNCPSFKLPSLNTDQKQTPKHIILFYSSVALATIG